MTAIRERYQLTSNDAAGQTASHNFEYLNKKVESTIDNKLPKVEDRSVIQLVNKFISEAIRLPHRSRWGM